jgi:serine/threonine protein kinase
LQPEDPQRIGPYRLLRSLGSGGVRRTYLGLSPDGRLVAVKVLDVDLAADPHFRARFLRELDVVRRVHSPRTVPVVDAGMDGPLAWLATAYVAGPSLGDAVNRHGPLPPASVLALAAGVAKGLSAIHAAGVVHRDLKPSNVLLTDRGPRVVDIAVAQLMASVRTGLVVGSSPEFMPPELVEGFMSPELIEGPGSGSGFACDLFSMGAVLTFASTGRSPFRGGSTVAQVYNLSTSAQVYNLVAHGLPDLDGVPAEVIELVRRCLAKDPHERPTAAYLVAELGDTDLAEGWLPTRFIGDAPGSVPSG